MSEGVMFLFAVSIMDKMVEMNGVDRMIEWMMIGFNFTG